MTHRVVAFVRPPQSPFEISCAARILRRPHYDFRVCAEKTGEVPTTDGYPMVVRHGLPLLDSADTIVVPGWTTHDQPLSPAVKAKLIAAHERGARLVSICTGAFALAQTGLLDGRRATTHWSAAADLAERFPRVRVDPDVLYVDHGDIATSGGAGAGIDLCLHLARSDHGVAYAAQVAREMVMPPHREGGQAQYAAKTTETTPRESLAPLLDWVTERLAEPITIDDMAARLSMSPRTLARRFATQLGVSPGQWLLTQRIDAARAMLEETDLPVETIAGRVGLASATNLRRRFHRAVRTTPAAYRRTFRAAMPSMT
ncbi:GlxA family transcriptional regulator [Fodinicola acaciae]|uniref:GlxA family transcriptional regulator n=1 Tax=Fodinicola acaciae TaxID=2681555 RepID=UPI0013D2234D|nr:helix-turn-helix domain-containing protein [Fodinicola acaciae]